MALLVSAGKVCAASTSGERLKPIIEVLRDSFLPCVILWDLPTYGSRAVSADANGFFAKRYDVDNLSKLIALPAPPRRLSLRSRRQNRGKWLGLGPTTGWRKGVPDLFPGVASYMIGGTPKTALKRRFIENKQNATGLQRTRD